MAVSNSWTKQNIGAALYQTVCSPVGGKFGVAHLKKGFITEARSDVSSRIGRHCSEAERHLIDGPIGGFDGEAKRKERKEQTTCCSGRDQIGS